MSNDQKRRENERYENLARKEPIVMARFKVRSGEAQEMESDTYRLFCKIKSLKYPLLPPGNQG